jgi:hypothetical protein
MSAYRHSTTVVFRIIGVHYRAGTAMVQGRDMVHQRRGASTFTFELEHVDGGWRAAAILTGLHT